MERPGNKSFKYFSSICRRIRCVVLSPKGEMSAANKKSQISCVFPWICSLDLNASGPVCSAHPGESQASMSIAVGEEIHGKDFLDDGTSVEFMQDALKQPTAGLGGIVLEDAHFSFDSKRIDFLLASN